MNSDFHKPSPNGCKFRIMITNISIFPFPPQIFADKSSAPPHIAPATPRRKPLWRGESRKGRERKDARTKREMARKGKAEERRERERRAERAKDGRSAVAESGGALLRKGNGLSSMKRRDVVGICLHGAHFPKNVFHVTCLMSTFAWYAYVTTVWYAYVTTVWYAYHMMMPCQCP